MTGSRFGPIAKMLATYLLLVAPPLAGLLAILHLGEGLTAPRAIGGDWQLALDPVPGAAACPELPDARGRLRLHVSQSGSRAEGSLSGATRSALSLALRDDRITGEGRRASGACTRVALDARLVGAALVGTMRYPECRGCPAISFRATRAAAR